MFIDPYYMIYMLPAFVLMMFATWYVNAAYRKWSQVAASSRLTGYQAAQRLVAASGLYGLQIKGIAGEMTDRYDPRDNTLYLSRRVAETPSVASLAIAAHELGHALQDKEGYLPLRFRSAIVPMVNIGSYLGWILIVAGLILGWTNLAWLGVVFFSGGAVFALATLPVEWNASQRARRLLTESGILYSEEERRGVNHVLNAAALTYVAALITALLQLLYFVGLIRRR
ncbi:MAG: zinc metallopeptidase [Anaerolineales bacterium]